MKVRENRAEKIDYYRAYDVKRFKEDPKVKQRHKRYQATDAGKEAIKRSVEKWKSSNPEKRAAHVLLGNAVRDGKVIKPQDCQSCNQPTTSHKLHAHHDDYTKPLNVTWLCAQCHYDLHHRSETA